MSLGHTLNHLFLEIFSQKLKKLSIFFLIFLKIFSKIINYCVNTEYHLILYHLN